MLHPREEELSPSDVPQPTDDLQPTDRGDLAGRVAATDRNEVSDPPRRRLHDLPPALPVRDHLGDVGSQGLAVFLDYDGTLTPIVDDPDGAVLDPRMGSAAGRGVTGRSPPTRGGR